jgi:hypothetical protein
MSRPMRRLPPRAILLVLSTLIGACGQAPPTGATHVARTVKAAQAGKPGHGIDPDMVNAVNLSGTSTSLIGMKFKLGGRPKVTDPLQVTVLVVPAADATISHIHVTFRPDDGLLLQSEGNWDVTDLSAGTPVEQDLTVVPQKSGVLSLDATVLVDTGTESISRTYVIPLIASDSNS